MPEPISSLEAVLDSLTDHAVFRLDDGGRVISWNKAAEKNKGYQASEIIGQHFSVFYTQDDQENDLPARGLAEARETGRCQTEGLRVRKDGTRFHADVVIQPLLGAGGRMNGFVKVTRNIDDRYTLQKLRDELQHSQRFELVGQLTGGIAHDFNNLLTAIESTFELIRLSSDDERIERYLSINRVAIDRSRKLIAQLLAFSRKQILHPKPMNVNDAASVFAELLQKAVGDGIRLTWRLTHDIPYVNIDGGHMQSALMNLVINARDAMPAGGELTIFSERRHVGPEEFEAPYDIPAGLYVAIGVTDTGTGMSEEVARRCVEPFFTTKDVGRGTGLGLSQCFGFARQSGGTLEIRTVEWEGATVAILLPTARDSAASDGSKRTVLLVEDDSSVRELAAELLRTLGYSVIEAADAVEALSLLQRDLSINLLFTDIVMPNGINGLQLLTRAREMRPGLPAVLTSGYTQTMVIGTVDAPSNAPFLRKPYTLEDLRESLSGQQPSIRIH